MRYAETGVNLEINLTSGNIVRVPTDPKDTELYLATNKGGVFKIFRGDRLAVSDTQISLQVLAGGRLKNVVGHLIDDYQVDLAEDEISVEGSLGWANQTQMTTLKLLVLRIVMYTVGRFFPNLIRKLLQSMLITSKKDAPFTFRRRLAKGDSPILAARKSGQSPTAGAGIRRPPPR